MKRNILLIVVLITVDGFFAINDSNLTTEADRSALVSTLNQSKNDISNLFSSLSSRLFAIETGETAQSEKDAAKKVYPNQTPIFSIFKEYTPGNTYYYHFTSKTPTVARQAFNDAISTYNNTGLVKLVEGNGSDDVNTITFSIYHDNQSYTDGQTIELGKGGPQLTYSPSDASKKAINHAKASINMSYSESVADSVTVHELGHALGLEHSKDPSSVMYPSNQGVSKLSESDLNALRSIYSKN
ncbi:M57 family metalloprotease [Companilactobacillus metriopterae]|uniref:M57 family metalloprotease n=1 Tax=Companilactobacillus metriopterae TaxID=1909267 RepID=UPI00100A8A0C|nr:M57 family metalloprotease [Companilactobacillus metriopterae]